MALINRFSRLFRADLHAVLDRIEEPTILLKQAVREMEDDVNQDERNLKIFEHELEQIPVKIRTVHVFGCRFCHRIILSGKALGMQVEQSAAKGFEARIVVVRVICASAGGPYHRSIWPRTA